MGNAIAEKCNKDKLKNPDDIHMCRAYIGGAFIGFFELLVALIMITVIIISLKWGKAFELYKDISAGVEGGSTWYAYVLVVILLFSGFWLTGISFAGQSYLPRVPS